MAVLGASASGEESMGSRRAIAGSVPMTDGSRTGEARRLATAIAAERGLGETDVGNVAVVVTELARNLLDHATGGELVVRPLEDDDAPGVEILALDRGPGIANVAACLADGYSTGGTPGTGLGAASRLSTLFDIHSVPGVGTAMLARIWSRRPGGAPAAPDPPEIGGICLPMPGETVPGDAWTARRGRSRTRLLVADGLGHGPVAGEAAQAAIAAFRDGGDASPAETLDAIHAALRGTRGAAAAVAELDSAQGLVRFAGVGNIAGTVVSQAGTRHVVSHNGILGHGARKIQEFTYDWPPDALLVMHSDGLASRWSLDRYPGLQARHPGLVAGVLYRDFARGRDDVTVVAVRARSGGVART